VLALALTLSPAGAHVTSEFAHLWNDHILPRIQSPGTINDDNNPVVWTKLKNVPEGFADGADATGLNAVSHTAQLTGAGRPTDPLGVNTSEIQRRAAEVCPAGQAIRGIGVTGAVSCTAGPSVFAAFHDAGIVDENSNLWTLVADLDLPAGSWAIFGKVIVNGKGPTHLTCRLLAGSDLDYATVKNDIDDEGSQHFNAYTVPLLVAHASGSPFTTTLDCRNNFDDGYIVKWAKITAIRAGTFSNVST